MEKVFSISDKWARFRLFISIFSNKSNEESLVAFKNFVK